MSEPLRCHEPRGAMSCGSPMLRDILAWSVLVFRAAVVLEREAPMIQRSILLLFGGACIATSASAQQSKRPDAKAIAHQLIASTMLREGQSVLISGSLRDAGLMEDLAIEARKAGAQPMLVISSERLIRRSYDEVPAKYDAQEPKLDLAVAKLFHAQIAIDVGETEGLLAGVPAERLAGKAKARPPVNGSLLERNAQFVHLRDWIYS